MNPDYIVQFRFLLRESLRGLCAAPFRTLLTMLGVIIGVAAVIAMMSIGGGARQETLNQIQQLGIKNLYISASKLTGSRFDEAKQKLSEGLSRADLQDFLAKIPGLEGGTYEYIFEGARFLSNEDEPKSNLVAVGPDYFDILPAKLKFGRFFHASDFSRAEKVVILGEKLAFELFGNIDACGSFVQISHNNESQTFRIVGVLQNAIRKEKAAQGQERIQIGERERDRDVYFPYDNLRYRFPIYLAQESDSEKDPSYAEISTIVLRLEDPETMPLFREFADRILKRRHKEIDDYQIIAPLDLLESSRKVQEIFNLVMIFIAGLSLVVGGIGIMNIMLANIQQRVKEIGIRRAIGATKHDILLQFLFEAVTISVGGGLLGLLAGIIISFVISVITGWLTVLSVGAMFISFTVSVAVGLVFGIFPARRAAEMDPISALRYE
jgi:putative ABC transport system permease protein